jgi:Icc-related predicted phosphoesterase
VGAAFFVSDLHGHIPRWRRLFEAVARERPAALFIGGDILPPAWGAADDREGEGGDFTRDFLGGELRSLRQSLAGAYPRVFLILGNDDARCEEESILDIAAQGLWDYAHDRRIAFGDYTIYGYAFVPPTPFLLKDWERYDVSRYVDPGSVSPEEGFRTVPLSESETRYSTIEADLKRLAGRDDLDRAVFLFHSPPYGTKLDVSVRGGMLVDHVPLDRHLGSIAIRRFIEARQPLLTLHGHIHESPRLSSSWRDRLGRTHCFSAAHDGPELALVRFELDHLDAAERTLVDVGGPGPDGPRS